MAEREKILLLHIGRCTISNGKPGLQFYHITQEEYDSGVLNRDSDNQYIFAISKSTKRMNIIGGIFEVDGEKSESVPNRYVVYTGAEKYLGYWKNEDDRNLWYTNSKVSDVRNEAEKRMKTDKNINLLKESLKPLRQIYKQLYGTHRSIFIAMVTMYITGVSTND